MPLPDGKETPFGLGFISIIAADIYVFGTQFVANIDLSILMGPSACYGDDKAIIHGEVFSTITTPRIGLVLVHHRRGQSSKCFSLMIPQLGAGFAGHESRAVSLLSNA